MRRRALFDGRDPLYVQIADQIRADVLSGALGAEEQVMSTTQYATTFRINPATAAKAFTELVDEGVLYKRRGIGMFVAPGAREQLLTRKRAAFFADVVDPVRGAGARARHPGRRRRRPPEERGTAMSGFGVRGQGPDGPLRRRRRPWTRSRSTSGPA